MVLLQSNICLPAQPYLLLPDRTRYYLSYAHVQDKGKVLDMGPTWSPKDGFGLCCGFPVDGYENNGISNGTSGGSAISPSGWLFNICNETSRCADHSPAFPLAQWFIRLWDVSAYYPVVISLLFMAHPDGCRHTPHPCRA